MVEIWDSLPGVKPVTKFANRKAATSRMWEVIQLRIPLKWGTIPLGVGARRSLECLGQVPDNLVDLHCATNKDLESVD
jgi:hypothetical protein